MPLPMGAQEPYYTLEELPDIVKILLEPPAFIARGMTYGLIHRNPRFQKEFRAAKREFRRKSR